jgi:predicted RNA-binding protein YlxR (DUF448 family)
MVGLSDCLEVMAFKLRDIPRTSHKSNRALLRLVSVNAPKIKLSPDGQATNRGIYTAQALNRLGQIQLPVSVKQLLL